MSLGGKTCLVVHLFFFNPSAQASISHAVCRKYVSLSCLLTGQDRTCFVEDGKSALGGGLWNDRDDVRGFRNPGKEYPRELQPLAILGHQQFRLWVRTAAPSLQSTGDRAAPASAGLCCPLVAPRASAKQRFQGPVSDLWETSQPQSWRPDTSVFKTEILRFSTGAPTSQLSRASFAIWSQE